MIEPWPALSGVSLFEAVLARWLVQMAGVQDVVDDPTPADDAPAPAPMEDSAADEERFPGLTRWRGLLEAGAGHLAAATAAEEAQRRQAAAQLRALAAFARLRPAELLDRPDTEVGAAAAASRAARPAALTAVSEWAVDEVMVALGLSSRAAAGLLADAVTLDERLPATLDALEAGRIGMGHARMLAEVVGPVKDEARAGVEARLLARAEGKTVPQLREAARRAVLRADAAAAARKLAGAIRQRSVRLQPGDDGMGTLTAVMPLPVAQACRRALEAYAEDCKVPGDERTLEQRMLDCLADLILRPGINPPVQISLTVVAGVDTMTGGDEPGEVDGQPVPAILVRELAHTLGLLPRPETTDTPTETAEPETEPEPESEPAAAEVAPDLDTKAVVAETEPGTESALDEVAPDLETEAVVAETEPGTESALDEVAPDLETEAAVAPTETGLETEAATDEVAPDVETETASVDSDSGSDECADLDGVAEAGPEAIPATHGEPLPDDAPEPSEEARAEAAPGSPDRRGNEAAAALGELLGLHTVIGTALSHLPTIAIVEEISGQLLALTTATEIRRTATCGRTRCRTGKHPCDHPLRGPGLGPPPDTPGYSPSVPLGSFVRARDRRCRFPGCRASAIRCDLDHNTPWPAGTTSADNLCCLCRHHHRLSHQAPGWTMTRLPDGGLQWTTPGGDTLTTHPPRYGSDDDLPPPTADPPPPDPDDEPAPF